MFIALHVGIEVPAGGIIYQEQHCPHRSAIISKFLRAFTAITFGIVGIQ